MQGVAWGLLEKLAGLDRLRIGWSALAWQSRGVGWARPSIGDVQGLLPSTRMLKGDARCSRGDIHMSLIGQAGRRWGTCVQPTMSSSGSRIAGASCAVMEWSSRGLIDGHEAGRWARSSNSS
ncbi:hypothetical protein RhiirA1_405870, partial [Rhizophagus irregularis]